MTSLHLFLLDRWVKVAVRSKRSIYCYVVFTLKKFCTKKSNEDLPFLQCKFKVYQVRNVDNSFCVTFPWYLTKLLCHRRGTRLLRSIKFACSSIPQWQITMRILQCHMFFRRSWSKIMSRYVQGFIWPMKTFIYLYLPYSNAYKRFLQLLIHDLTS